MKKQIIAVFIAGILHLTLLQAQPVVFVNAGSRTAWGTNQELTIDANGQCRYYMREAMTGNVKDSVFFSITASQLAAFFDKAETLGFFDLNTVYDSGKTDGAGVYISLNDKGRKKRVSVANVQQPAVDGLIAYLNEILAPQKIRIYYGQSSPSK